jgi:hypothetical protein
VTDQNKETDFVKAPEVSAFRYSYKEPTEEKSIKRNQQQGMGKIPMVFEIKLAFEETKNKIGVGEESHSQTCNRSPISNLFITDSFGNDRTCKRMSQAVHEFMVTSFSLIIYSVINHINVRHSRESGNPGQHWIPGQARNDKLHKTYVVVYS